MTLAIIRDIEDYNWTRNEGVDMAKLRGKQKWKHCLTVQGELWALERELDSMSQKGMDVARQLGRVRSIILRTHTDDQKTLKRWIKPAPNQVGKI
ncbi:uncharacterized protein METZ01_LOCUS447636 [marine metagenome]|uniref:Uncharacterized protein n=1 Tax=marine metagenome TaxID=408172 RepID=A0A382ZH35_9ZZZZ